MAGWTKLVGQPSIFWDFIILELFSDKVIVLGRTFFASEASTVANDIITRRSPAFPKCAAAPRIENVLLPRGAGIAYVSKRSPLVILPTSIFS